MHRKQINVFDRADLSIVSRVVCFCSFAFGCILGTICASTSSGGALVVVKTSLSKIPGYISVNDTASSFFFCGISLISIILVLLSSFFIFGSVSVPFILFFKAYSFSYCCACMIFCGQSDLFYAFILCSACDVLFFIPVCICIAVKSFECSCRLFEKVFRGRAVKVYDFSFVKSISALIALTGAALTAQFFLIPLLVDRI